LCADLTVLIRGSVSSGLFGGGSYGVGCAAPETGEHLEILVFILHADLLHRRVHPRVNDVETEHLRTLAARRPDDDTAALRGVAVAVDPAAAFEPVEDAGHGGGCSPAHQSAWAGATYGDALFGIGIIALLLAVCVLVRGARRGLGDGQPRYRRPAHWPMAGLRRRSDAGARPHGQTVVSPAATQSLISYIAKHDMIQDSAGSYYCSSCRSR